MEALSPGVKQPRLEDIFLPHLVTRLRMRAAKYPFSLYAFMVSAKHLSSFLPECIWSKKIKFTLEQAMKAEKGSRGTALLFSLTLGLDGGG
jgi:hypothetical protein